MIGKAILRFLLAALLFASGASASSLPEHWWPENHLPELAQLLGQLETTGPRQAIEQARIQAAEQSQQVAEHNRWPTVGADGNMVIRHEWREKTDDQFIASPFGRLYVRQDIYQWGALEAQRTVAAIQTAMTRRDAAEVLRQVRQHVRTLYLTGLVLGQETSYWVGEVERRARSLEAIEQLVAQGQAQQLEAAEARLRLTEARLSQAEASGQLRQVARELAHTCGVEQEPGFSAQADSLERLVEPLRGQLEAPADPGLSPALRQHYQQIQINREQYTVIASQTRPNFELVGQLFQDQTDTSSRDNIDRVVAEVALRVRWNFFDGHRTRHEKLRNLAERRQLEGEAQWQQAQDRLQWLESLETRTLRQEQERVQRARLDLASAVLAEKEQDFAAGHITRAELDAARAAADEARLKLWQRQSQLAIVTTRLLTYWQAATPKEEAL